jgi:hypothetical protein
MPADLPIISVPRTSCAELRVFAAQARGFHRAADHHHQLVDVEGLLDEVVGALLDRGDRDLDVAMARDDDDRHIGVVALDVLEDVDPVHVAVLEPDIEDHQPRRGRVQLGHASSDVPARRVVKPSSSGYRRSVRGYRVRRPPSEYRHLQLSRVSARSRGNVMRAIAPRCAPSSNSSASTSSRVPPCSSMIFFTMGRPRPVPFSRVVT